MGHSPKRYGLAFKKGKELNCGWWVGGSIMRGIMEKLLSIVIRDERCWRQLSDRIMIRLMTITVTVYSVSLKWVSQTLSKSPKLRSPLPRQGVGDVLQSHPIPEFGLLNYLLPSVSACLINGPGVP